MVMIWRERIFLVGRICVEGWRRGNIDYWRSRHLSRQPDETLPTRRVWFTSARGLLQLPARSHGNLISSSTCSFQVPKSGISKQEILMSKCTELTLIILLDAWPPILCQRCACYAIVIYSKWLLFINSSSFPSPSTQTCSCSLCGFFETLYTRSSVQNWLTSATTAGTVPNRIPATGKTPKSSPVFLQLR
jgi:hypothetical protein